MTFVANGNRTLCLELEDTVFCYRWEQMTQPASLPTSERFSFEKQTEGLTRFNLLKGILDRKNGQKIALRAALVRGLFLFRKPGAELC